MTINKSSFFVFSLFMLYYFTSYSTDSLLEQELSYSHLGTTQRNQLRDTIATKREQCLGMTFTEGDEMINLMGPLDPDTQIIQNARGELKTRCKVPEGFKYTIKQSDYGIIPYIDTINEVRVARMDGKGYGKESPDGSLVKIGRFYPDSFKPTVTSTGERVLAGEFASLSREVKTDLAESQRQRRPEGMRDKDFARRTTVSKKPTPEDIAGIEQSNREPRLNQLDELKKQFGKIPTNLLEGTEIKNIIKQIRLGFELLLKNIDDEHAFKTFLINVQGKVAKVKAETDKLLRTDYSQQLSQMSIESFSLEEVDELKKQIKEQAQRQIEARGAKEQSHLDRPNAHPITIIEAEEENLEEPKEKTPTYVFSAIPNHKIINALQQTSTEDSSYSGIKISRQQLENFITFLKNEEKAKRTSDGDQVLDTDDLGYYFDPAQGKGSHIKVKFGHGTKPVTLSRQGGNILTVDQLRDIKKRLIHKGLITIELATSMP